MEKQFTDLKTLGSDLVSHVRVPAVAGFIPREMEGLEERWSAMREAILGTLGKMRMEMEKWVKGKVAGMRKLAGEEDEMLSRVIAFVEGFPLDSLLRDDLTDLFGEVEELGKYDVSIMWEG